MSLRDRWEQNGEANKALAIAEAMFKDAQPLDKVAEYTQLSLSEVENLQKRAQNWHGSNRLNRS